MLYFSYLSFLIFSLYCSYYCFLIFIVMLLLFFSSYVSSYYYFFLFLLLCFWFLSFCCFFGCFPFVPYSSSSDHHCIILCYRHAHLVQSLVTDLLSFIVVMLIRSLITFFFTWSFSFSSWFVVFLRFLSFSFVFLLFRFWSFRFRVFAPKKQLLQVPSCPPWLSRCRCLVGTLMGPRMPLIAHQSWAWQRRSFRAPLFFVGLGLARLFIGQGDSDHHRTIQGSWVVNDDSELSAYYWPGTFQNAPW